MSSFAQAGGAASRPLRTHFAVAAAVSARIQEPTVVACGKGGLGSGPGPKRGNARKWQYPSYARTAKAKAQHRKGEKAARRDKRLLNLGFNQCLICQEIILHKTDNEADAEVRCRQPCSAYFHKGCADEWLKGASSCPQCKIVPMFEGGPTEAPMFEGGSEPYHCLICGRVEYDEDQASLGGWEYVRENDGWVCDCIRDFYRSFSSDRILPPLYFGGNETHLSIVNSSDIFRFETNVLPIWEPESSTRPDRIVNGYFFQNNAVTFNMTQHNRDLQDGIVHDGVTHNGSLGGNYFDFYNTLMNPRNDSEYWKDVCLSLRSLQNGDSIWRAADAVRLVYEEFNNFGQGLWIMEHGNESMLRIVTDMQAKGLVKGSDELVKDIDLSDFEDVAWPEEVDFVFMLKEGNDVFDTSIFIRPARLADYIESGGELW